jgi:hypothetical protein
VPTGKFGAARARGNTGLLESMGGDFPTNEDVAARIADGTAVANNTLGFVKHTLAAALEPSPYFGPRDGLYVRVASSLAHAW